jgi:hypothetical protein
METMMYPYVRVVGPLYEPYPEEDDGEEVIFVSAKDEKPKHDRPATPRFLLKSD